MLTIRCDRCGAEVDKDHAAALSFRPRAFAAGDRRGPLTQQELCQYCAQKVITVLTGLKKEEYHV